MSIDRNRSFFAEHYLWRWSAIPLLFYDRCFRSHRCDFPVSFFFSTAITVVVVVFVIIIIIVIIYQVVVKIRSSRVGRYNWFWRNTTLSIFTAFDLPQVIKCCVIKLQVFFGRITPKRFLYNITVFIYILFTVKKKKKKKNNSWSNIIDCQIRQYKILSLFDTVYIIPVSPAGRAWFRIF